MNADSDLLAVLKRVVNLSNCAMDYSGVDAEHTLKRVLERVGKMKCICEAVLTENS